jgi:hypothetical protein
MGNKRTGHQQSHSLQNEIHAKNSRLYKMRPLKKWGHLR